MRRELSQDSLAMLLLCSNLGLPRCAEAEAEADPLTLREWNELAKALKASSLGRPAALLASSPEEWKETLGLPVAETERLRLLLSRGGSLAIELERLESLGVWVTTRVEEAYPQRLKQVLNSRAPVFLYGAGDPGLLDGEGVAVVGSRDVDEAGAAFAARLAERCVESGFFVVSGGARGIDQVAQNAAFNAEGDVVSVLPQGLEAMIRKRDVREALLSGHLLLLSTAHPKSPFSVGQAMKRNKYIYALSSYAVVVSSAYAKGGTWEGAVEDLRHGWVPLFVRAGEEVPEGNRRLLNRKEGRGIPMEPEALEPGSSLRQFFREAALAGRAAEAECSKACEESAEYQAELPFEEV
jgi:predicted Rossmann fold nucleotide-binding protein DprA/Smf involved in DNA uptake